jgi:predicted DNA-binding protein
MRNETHTRLSIDVPHQMHQALKFFTAKNHLNIKDYVLKLIEDDLSEEMEDYLLGQMALKAMRDGTIGVKKSQQILKKFKAALPNKKSSFAKIKS